MLEIIWNLINFIADIGISIWVISFILFGGKWQVGNFMSLRMHAILYKSKRKYKEEQANE